MSYRFDEKDHCHLWDEQPLYGTTTAIKTVMPPHLAKWGGTCSIDFLRDGCAIEEHNGKEYLMVPTNQLTKAIDAWKTVLKGKAKGGTNLHDKLETYVKRCIEENGGKPITQAVYEMPEVETFAKWALTYVKRFIHSEANVYSTRLWVGGVLDVVFERKDGVYCLGDFKSAKELYMSQMFQNAGYDIQQRENGFYNAAGDKVGEPLELGAYYVFTFGGVGFQAHEHVALEKLRQAFEYIMGIYELLPKGKKYGKRI